MGVEMKRRYKLLIIIIIGSLITFFIYFSSKEDKINIVALGDAISLGMTPYNVPGISYNDYLSEYYENKNLLKDYNKEFCLSHLTSEKLNYMLDKNEIGKTSHKAIKQIIEKADILTIALGTDEFADVSLRTKDYSEYISNFINEYKNILATIRTFYDKEIIILGIYPAYNLDKNNTITINKELRVLSLTYDTKFLDLLPISLNSKYYLQTTSYYMNYEAHQKIFQEILTILNKNV